MKNDGGAIDLMCLTADWQLTSAGRPALTFFFAPPLCTLLINVLAQATRRTVVYPSVKQNDPGSVLPSLF